jgi:hypothetical protein
MLGLGLCKLAGQLNVHWSSQRRGEKLSYAEQRDVAWAETVIAITKPSWIAAASLPDLKSVMHKIRRDHSN